MRHGIMRVTRVLGLVLAGAVAWSLAIAQNAAPVSLQEQLDAQYKLAKTSRATGEYALTDPGTVLQIQKRGIVGSSPRSMAVCPSKFENGSLKNANTMCVAMVGMPNIRFLKVGEKVYPTKMEVNLAKDKIVFAIIECDSCNGVNDPSSYRSEVIFQFAKGSLASANAGAVEDTIGQVFSISSDDDAQQNQGEPQGGGNAQPAPAPAEAQPEPQEIHLGQTIDQVVSTLGKPMKTVDLGAKQIYVYKDLKITFVNGKVSDVQ